MDRNNFPENLIKGRIAETVFELMFREATPFEIYPLGYEHTTPILRQYRDNTNQEHKDIIKSVLDNFDSSPDFLLTMPDRSKVYLVEVKYRNWVELNKDEVLKIAQEIHTRWHPCKLFIATSEGFFYDSCKDIIDHNGEMSRLGENIVNAESQKYYHDLLMRFEK